MGQGVHLVELFAGTASLSLYAMGRCDPLTGYMGSKRKLAPRLCELLGLETERPERVTLVDAGPWGFVWSVLRQDEARRAVAALLRSWSEEDPHELWERLVRVEPRADDPVWNVAQYLWLQARSAGTIPIWFNEERARWESPTGARTETGHQRGGMAADKRQVNDKGQPERCSPALGRQKQRAPNRPKSEAGEAYQKDTTRHSRAPDRPYEAGSFDRRRAEREEGGKLGRAAQKGGHLHSLAAPVQVDSSEAKVRRVLELTEAAATSARWRAGCRGIQFPQTIARRIEALDRIDWSRVAVIHGLMQDVEPITGCRVCVYLDPPYVGCPRYAVLCDRAIVLAVALRWVASGAQVAISEGEPLALPGWDVRRLPARKPEWLTTSWTLTGPEQLPLFRDAGVG